MMKNVILFISGLFLVIATCDVAGAAFTYADQVIYMDPTPMGAPNHAPSMNMNWLNNPGDLYSDPNPYNDRLLGAYDQYAIGWGPAGLSWTGTANAIVKMEKPFTHDGVVATGGNVEHTVTDEGALSGMGYDLVIYGLGYGFDGPFESHGQIRVWVAEELSGNIDDWILVSSWSGDPNGYGDDPPTYFENQDGTLKDGIAFNNGGFGAWSHTFMTIDLDNPKIIDPATGELMNVGPITGVYNYIWFEGGYYEDDGSTHSNANFLDAFAAHHLNHAPVAENGELTVYENISGAGSLIASDIDGGDLTYSIVETGNHGLAEILDESTGLYRYTPETDYTGADTLKFKANDGEADSNIATITITIKEVDPDNNPPIAEDGQLAIFENEVGNGNLIASDIDSDDLTYAIVENADHGIAMILDPITGSYRYTPETDYTGADTFTFKANDGEVDSDTATITITVHTVNHAPEAEAGVDQTACSGDTVTLDASGSSDPDPDDEIAYQWDQIAGPEVGISDKSAIRPTFTAPAVGLEGETLEFELTVSDGEFSDTDTVTVEIVYNIVAASVFATSVTEQRGCISWEWGVPDEGANAVGRPDYESNGDLSGWTNTAGYLTLAFDVPLADGKGDDLMIHYSGQGKALVAVSQDGEVWTYPVPLPAVMEGDYSLHQACYDLSELGVTSLRYVKIEKTETAGGIFVDAVEGLHVRAVRVYATSVKDQSGCVSRSFDPDGGEHALGEPNFETGGDYSGWIDNTVGYLTLGFNAPVADGQGNDLTIYHSGWAETFVAVSEDGQNWTDPLELPEGVGAVHQYSYDFTELGITSARYVKIIKEEASGVRFIDAVKGHYGISGSVDPAGKDQTVKEGTSVTLGAGSNPSGAVYRWVQIKDGAPLVILSADNAPSPTFIAPMVADEESVLKFALSMDDNDSPFETIITVMDNGITDITGDSEFTFNNPISGKNMGMSCDGGVISDYDIMDPNKSYSVDMTDGPEDLIYGLISFEAQVAAGDTVAVTIYLPEPAPAGYKWYKHNDTDGWFDFSRDVILSGSGDRAEFNDDRTQVTLYITDNGDYDDDKRDGVIRDPSGLGQPAGTGDEPGGDGSAGGSGSGGGGGCFISASAYSNSLTPLYLVFIILALSWIMTGTQFRMKR